MRYICKYSSPLGGITIAGDGDALIGLWFDGQKYFGAGLAEECAERELPVFARAREWLDIYFQGKAPDFTPSLSFTGVSPFRRRVWELLLEIPFGATETYGNIAAKIRAETGRNVSAQAVGGAVGHNRISLIIPCHRAVGADGSLTGYAGGIDKKIALLKLEGADTAGMTVPKKGTAL